MAKDSGCMIAMKAIIYVGFGVALPIACLVIASKYDGQCPVQPYVNIYLYVSGAFCLLRGVIGLGVLISINCGCFSDKSYCCCLAIDIIVGVFLFAWFIAGSVWVYKLKDNFSTDPKEPHYCNPDLYKFAFWVLTAQWILNAVSMALSSLASCCQRN